MFSIKTITHLNPPLSTMSPPPHFQMYMNIRNLAESKFFLLKAVIFLVLVIYNYLFKSKVTSCMPAKNTTSK